MEDRDRRSGRRAFRSYCIIVGLFVSGMLIYLWAHVTGLHQRKELALLGREREVLVRRQDRLQAEIAGLKTSRRIREIASEKLDMVFPSGTPRNLYTRTEVEKAGN